jgi:transcriptional regulator
VTLASRGAEDLVRRDLGALTGNGWAAEVEAPATHDRPADQVHRGLLLDALLAVHNAATPCTARGSTVLYLARLGITEEAMGGSDLFTGTLDLLILGIVEQQPLHGYAIGKHIREASRGVVDLEEGALYPALHRLRRKQLVTSAWRRTETGRRAKYYSITPAGARRLAEERDRWQAFSDAVRAVLGTSAG